MPLTQYQSSFSPETLKLLQDVFEAAWAEAAGLLGDRIDEQAARDLIARRIAEAARDHGEQDPTRLKAYALEPFRA